MNIDTYFRRFIFLFFFGKIFLIAIAFTLGGLNAYANHQVRDILYIVAPTLAASMIIFLNYLKSTRNKKIEPKNQYQISRTEVVIVFAGLIFYILFVTLQLFSLQAADYAFNSMKAKIAFVETLMGGLLGWTIIEINNHTV